MTRTELSLVLVGAWFLTLGLAWGLAWFAAEPEDEELELAELTEHLEPRGNVTVL